MIKKLEKQLCEHYWCTFHEGHKEKDKYCKLDDDFISSFKRRKTLEIICFGCVNTEVVEKLKEYFCEKEDISSN